MHHGRWRLSHSGNATARQSVILRRSLSALASAAPTFAICCCLLMALGQSATLQTMAGAVGITCLLQPLVAAYRARRDRPFGFVLVGDGCLLCREMRLWLGLLPVSAVVLHPAFALLSVAYFCWAAFDLRRGNEPHWNRATGFQVMKRAQPREKLRPKVRSTDQG